MSLALFAPCHISYVVKIMLNVVNRVYFFNDMKQSSVFVLDPLYVMASVILFILSFRVYSILLLRYGTPTDFQIFVTI